VKIVKINGKKRKHKVFMYAISTCAWCKKTKQFLKDNNIEFEYVDVDLSSDEDKEKIEEEINRRGGEPVYPTLVVDDKTLITGYKVDKITKALGL
jgi:glutaredoxin-like protein NrdH